MELAQMLEYSAGLKVRLNAAGRAKGFEEFANLSPDSEFQIAGTQPHPQGADHLPWLFLVLGGKISKDPLSATWFDLLV